MASFPLGLRRQVPESREDGLTLTVLTPGLERSLSIVYLVHTRVAIVYVELPSVRLVSDAGHSRIYPFFHLGIPDNLLKQTVYGHL